MTLTKEQFIALRQKGLSVDKIKAFESGQTPEDLAPKPQMGFGQELAQSIAKPFLKTGVTLAGGLLRGAQLLGSKRAGEKANELISNGVDTGYLGKVKPFGADSFQSYQSGDMGGGEFALRAGADALGGVAEIASYGVGGAGAVQGVKTGLKGLVKEGAKIGAKEGLKTGLLMGFGQGLQEASTQPVEEAFKTVVTDTALSGLVGTVTGGIGGATVPLVAKGVQGIKKFANVGELENKLAKGYQRVLNPNARQIKVDKKYGGDSFKFLSQEAPDLPLTVNSDGRIMADEAIEMARQKYTAEATAYKPIIRNSGKYVDIDSVVAKAKKQAREEFDGSDLVKAEKQIDDEINSFLAQTPQDINVTANGKRFVTLGRADDIKTYSWSRGKGWGSPDAEVWNDTNNLIGHALKDAIENELPSAPIKAMNRRLGQWKNAIDMLEKRNGQVSGTGGKLSKYIIRSVGTTIGAGTGGQDQTTLGRVGGAGAGYLTANAIASIMSNPNVRLFAVRQLLKRLQKAGRQDLITEAEQILQNESTKYLLPARGGSSYVETPAPAINLPTSIRETNLGLDEVKNTKIGTNDVKPNSQAGNVLKNSLLAGAGATALGVASQIPNEASFTKTPEEIQAESQPVNTPVNKPKVDYKKEISFRETGNVKKDPYTIVKKNTNGTYDLGKYQINTAALKAYGDDFLGKATTSKELLANPQLQEKFIEGFIKKMEDEGYDKDLIIAMWHRGWGNRSKERLAKLLNEDLTKKYLNNKPKE